MWKFCDLVIIVYIYIMKICKKCNTEKNESEFHYQNKKNNSLNAYCKICKKEYDDLYRKTDKVQNAQKSKRYRDRKAEYRKYIANTDPRKMIWNAAKSRAKNQNVPFDIELSDIIIPEYCPILDIKIERKEYGKGGSFQPNSPSLDKIIPSKGYIKGNIMIISMKANAMKYNATINELLKFSENMIKLIKEQNYGSS